MQQAPCKVSQPLGECKGAVWGPLACGLHSLGNGLREKRGSAACNGQKEKKASAAWYTATHETAKGAHADVPPHTVLRQVDPSLLPDSKQGFQRDLNPVVSGAELHVPWRLCQGPDVARVSALGALGGFC
eukprot:scaffold404_cov20-Tisochrysis_lutea.AAC.1